MTGEEICAQAELYAEDLEVDRTTGLKLINECQIMDLGKQAEVIDSLTLEVAENIWTSINGKNLPKLIEIFEIEKQGQDYPYYGQRYGEAYNGSFDFRNGYIRLPEAGTYTLWGYRLPIALSDSDIDEEPEAHQLLHYPMSMYVAYRSLLIEDEDDETAPTLMALYREKKNEVLKQIEKMRPTTTKARIIQPRPFM